VAPAATVLLLRESDDNDGALQVLMTQRAAGLSFMGGLWVFPGGRMETADRSPAATARAPVTDLEPTCCRMLDVSGVPLSHDEALGLHVAACRETFEESGVLLARRRAGSTCLDADLAARLASRRATTEADPDSFVQMLVDEDLWLDVDRLVYWSHWITPSLEKRRFDTRFFAVQVPAAQEACVDFAELTRHAWLAERDVRALLASGEIRLAPPTIATLEDLWCSHRRHGRVDAMLEAERARPVPPILPKVVQAPGGVEVVLPWDREYTALPGDACVVLDCYPPHLKVQPSRLALPAR
jgi:8-oxo-dGTP pyrophosphatase MutT (NUDIX family)